MRIIAIRLTQAWENLQTAREKLCRGRKLTRSMFTPPNLIGGFLFSGIGFVAFIYGKRMTQWKPMTLGVALMAYPYFVSDTRLLYIIGTALTAALFIFRD
jgi:hypothetical protein